MSIVSGDFQPAEIKKLAMWLMLVAAVSGITLVAFTGLPVLYFGIAAFVLTLFYPWFKYHALGDVDIFLTYSLLPLLGTSYVATGEIDFSVLWLALPIGLITVGILHANNSRDMEHDSRAGINTFAMLIGKKLSAVIYCLEVLLPFVWVVAVAAYGALPWWSLLVLPALLPAIGNARKAMLFITKGAEALYGLDENTAKLQLMFSLLLTVSLFVASLV
jgi:1,4-dihydroxy-2-naphthoate octaprenyltransferase